ncbi:hypothetical protein RHGRI_001707 [Rhododendron griersonianum]|uniref:Uncharacterized protein n=1 Tax=Rhododendron griersonianum TaxID=479676 RepID=A0AAV6LLR9_9ERIC|nr:hypothetical protein RHGRI_036046 [Rhododendron griersonianum]KAG5565881.1 hypothetical protein RHGRI_001707 [Rhododendron griersonianum]
MHDEMLENGVQEAVHVLLPKMLFQVLVRTPGTYGNKQFCPCYNNWKTKRRTQMPLNYPSSFFILHTHTVPEGQNFIN